MMIYNNEQLEGGKMKATLTFNYNTEEPEELEEIKKIIAWESPYHVLWAIGDHIRSKLKYHDLTEEQAAVYEEIQKLMYDELQEHDVKYR